METPEHHTSSLGSGPGAQPGYSAVPSAQSEAMMPAEMTSAESFAPAHASEVRGGLVVQQTNWLGASQVRAGIRQPRQWRAGQRRTQQLRG